MVEKRAVPSFLGVGNEGEKKSLLVRLHGLDPSFRGFGLCTVDMTMRTVVTGVVRTEIGVLSQKERKLQKEQKERKERRAGKKGSVHKVSKVSKGDKNLGGDDRDGGNSDSGDGDSGIIYESGIGARVTGHKVNLGSSGTCTLEGASTCAFGYIGTLDGVVCTRVDALRCTIGGGFCTLAGTFEGRGSDICERANVVGNYYVERLWGGLDVVGRAMGFIGRSGYAGEAGSGAYAGEAGSGVGCGAGEEVFMEVPPPHGMQSAGLTGLSFLLAERLLAGGFGVWGLSPMYLGYVLGKRGYRRSEVRGLARGLLDVIGEEFDLSGVRLSDDEACAVIFALRNFCKNVGILGLSGAFTGRLLGDALFREARMFNGREFRIG